MFFHDLKIEPYFYILTVKASFHQIFARFGRASLLRIFFAADQCLPYSCNNKQPVAANQSDFIKYKKNSSSNKFKSLFYSMWKIHATKVFKFFLFFFLLNIFKT